MDEYEKYRSEVVEASKPVLKEWLGDKYRGVCTDTVRESFCKGLSVERAVERATLDTFYWDGSW